MPNIWRIEILMSGPPGGIRGTPFVFVVAVLVMVVQADGRSGASVKLGRGILAGGSFTYHEGRVADKI